MYLPWNGLHEFLREAREEKLRRSTEAGMPMTSHTIQEPVERFGLSLENDAHLFFLVQGYKLCAMIFATSTDLIEQTKPQEVPNPDTIPFMVFRATAQHDVADLAEFVPPQAMANADWDQEYDGPIIGEAGAKWEGLGWVAARREYVRLLRPGLDSEILAKIWENSGGRDILEPLDPERVDDQLEALGIVAAAAIAADQILGWDDEGVSYFVNVFLSVILSWVERKFPEEVRERITAEAKRLTSP